MSVSVSDNDAQYKKFMKQMNMVQGSSVTVGIHEKDNETYPNGEGVAQVGAWNEFGNKIVPERSFIRSTVDSQAAEIDLKRTKLLDQAIMLKISVLKALESLGADVQRRIQNTIRAYGTLYPDKANAPSVMKRKRANKPLIDSGTLLRSINYEAHVE